MNEGYHARGLDYVYLAFKVEEKDVGKAVEAIRALGMAGANVTIPFKSKVIPFLDAIEESAKAIGAVNTIVNKKGKLVGYNTDCLGAMAALQEAGVNTRAKKAVVIGAGGASRAVCYALLKQKTRVVVFDRENGKASSLALEMRRKTGESISNYLMNNENLEWEISDADVLVNATPVGMWPKQEATPVPPGVLRKELAVFDLVYKPRFTKLLKTAKQKGCKTIFGESMLFYQGIAGFELITGKKAPLKQMKKALLKVLR